MSWGFSGIGKPKAVARKAAVELGRINCMEPEQTIKLHAGKIIEIALSAFPGSAAVQVEASGSQTTDGTAGTHSNQLSLKITPIYGFVEE